MEYQKKKEMFPLKYKIVCFLLANTEQYVFFWQIRNSMFPIESQDYVFTWQTLNNMFPIEKQKIMFPLGNPIESQNYVFS